MADHNCEQQEQDREGWLSLDTVGANLIPSECVSDILAEALRLQSLKQAQNEQKQENYTLQELEKIAEDVNLPIDILHDAVKAVLSHREQQALERQQKERDRQERRERAIRMTQQHTQKALPGILAGGGLVLTVVTIKNMLPSLTFYLAPPAASPLPILVPQTSANAQSESIAIQLPGAQVILVRHIGTTDVLGRTTVSGTLRSAKFCNRTELSSFVHDSDGNKLGRESTNIANLKAGELWLFNISSYERGAYRFEIDSFSCENN